MAQAQPFAIGREAKAAMDEEEKRLARGPLGPSPLPEGSYDPYSGQTDIARVSPSPLDEEVRAVIRSYAAQAESERAALRDRIDRAELDLLLTFASRSAIQAMREGSRVKVRDGLTALSMVDAKRIDARDLAFSIALLGYAAHKLGMDANEALIQAEALSGEPARSTMRQMRPHLPIKLSDWLVQEVSTPDGVGLIGVDLAESAATIDLASLSWRIAERLSTGRYDCRATVRTSTPPVWFSESGRPAAANLLAAARGGASIRGRLRPEHHPRHADQSMFVFLTEMPTNEQAAALSGVGPSDLGRAGAVIVFHVGRVVCMVVGTSCVSGPPAFETAESLAEIAVQVRETLEASNL